MEKPLEDTDVICQKQNETKYLKASKQNFSKHRVKGHVCFHPTQTLSGKRNRHRIVLTSFRTAFLNSSRVIAYTPHGSWPQRFLPLLFFLLPCLLPLHIPGTPLYVASLLDTSLLLTLSLRMRHCPFPIYFPYRSQNNLLKTQIWLNIKTQVLNMRNVII